MPNPLATCTTGSLPRDTPREAKLVLLHDALARKEKLDCGLSGSTSPAHIRLEKLRMGTITSLDESPWGFGHPRSEAPGEARAFRVSAGVQQTDRRSKAGIPTTLKIGDQRVAFRGA
ncbi:hypothetical protein AB5N19_07037 [Seiridium cardinale]